MFEFEIEKDPRTERTETPEQKAQKAWDPEDAVRALSAESEIMDQGDLAATARKLMEEALPVAVLSVIHIATNSANEKLRFDASKYLVERGLGPVKDGSLKPKDDPIEAMFKQLKELQDRAGLQ